MRRNFFRRLGLPPQTPLPDSEQLAGAELLHTGAHPRNLAFEMPGNRNGASDRGGDKHCDDHSRAWGWRGACPERLEKLQAVDKQLSNDTLAAGMDCFKNKKPELAERAFGKVLKLTSRRFNPKANFEAKVPHPTPPLPAAPAATRLLAPPLLFGAPRSPPPAAAGRGRPRPPSPPSRVVATSSDCAARCWQFMIEHGCRRPAPTSSVTTGQAGSRT